MGCSIHKRSNVDLSGYGVNQLGSHCIVKAGNNGIFNYSNSGTDTEK